MLFFEPGFIVFLLFVLILLWGVICAKAFLLQPPQPRSVGVVAVTQLVTVLLCELVWSIEWIGGSEYSLTSHLHIPDSIVVPIIILAYCICAIGFFTTMVLAMVKPNRANILCFFVSLFQALVFFWFFIVTQAWASC